MSLTYAEKVKRFLKDNGVDGRSKIVFRLEDDEGHGPYVWSKDRSIAENTRQAYVVAAKDPIAFGGTSSHRPTPYEDGIGHVDSEHRFGFNDLEQLRKWFTRPQRKALDEVGCHVYVYKVTPGRHLQVGNNQIAFKKRYAERIGKIKL